MKRWVILAVVAGGCKGFEPPPVVPTDTDVTETGVPTPPPEEDALTVPPGEEYDNGRFATADTCEECHSNAPTATAMRDNQGNGVAPYDLWQASMMANAARDPLWRAVVSAEIAVTPGAAEVIGKRCMNCHAPMAEQEALFTGEPEPTIATLTDPSAIRPLALDGVSCTMCHQIEPTNLGEPASWSGGYEIVPDQTIYGPHSNPASAYMDPTGWSPVEGDHLETPELCATCHTLITDALNADGTPNGGQLVEQSPYLEMKNSDSRLGSCQGCHMPAQAADQSSITSVIARQPDGSDYPDLSPRALSRHGLVGGNTLVPQLFRDYPEVLNPRAPPEAFDAKIAEARHLLQTGTAFLFIENFQVVGSTMTFTTYADPLTGHKFPTGIPLRRAWLKTTVTDGADQIVFQSGQYDVTGQILDGQGNPQPFEIAGGPIAPHLDAISSDDQVQVYEAIQKDIAGQATFHLLQGAGYLKDNRLLPRGWTPTFAQIDLIAAAGINGDGDYTTGGDRVAWTIDLTGHTGPWRMETQLLYQTLSNRFAAELFTIDTPEVAALQLMLGTADRRPVIISQNSETWSSP